MRRHTGIIKTLTELPANTRAVLHHFNLSQSLSEYLMNLGFLPGLEVSVVGSGPGGDPRIYRVDGTEVALRNELSRGILVSVPNPESAAL